jgi:hypothetical protein
MLAGNKGEAHSIHVSWLYTTSWLTMGGAMLSWSTSKERLFAHAYRAAR